MHKSEIITLVMSALIRPSQPLEHLYVHFSVHLDQFVQNHRWAALIRISWLVEVNKKYLWRARCSYMERLWCLIWLWTCKLFSISWPFCHYELFGLCLHTGHI